MRIRDREANNARVMECLECLGHGTAREIADRTKLSWNCVWSHLDELVAEGMLTREVVKTGATGRAAYVYRQRGGGQ